MKKFLAGSAVASIYTTSGELIAISNTQINDTINLSVESQEVRSGYGNALDYIYYHSTRMEGQLEDAQFNLDYIAHNLGAKDEKGGSVYQSQSLTFSSTNAMTIAGSTGLVGNYVWIYYKDKPYTFAATYDAGTGTISFSASDVLHEADVTALNGQDVCVKYLEHSDASNVRNLTISANFIPDIVKIVLEAQLFASESGVENSSRIGRVFFTIPKAQLSGTQEISMSASGVASTPLSYLALKADEIGGDACEGAAGVYGYITEILDNAGANWYDDVDRIFISGDVDGFTGTKNAYIDVYAYTKDGRAYIVNPKTRITYGYDVEVEVTDPNTQETSTEIQTRWVTDGSDNNIGQNGLIKTTTTLTTGDVIRVKVVDSEGADVESIEGDEATIVTIKPAPANNA